MTLVMSLISQKDNELLSWLDNAPQTNEVARSSIIFAGLSVIAEEFKKPISLFELGSSGGLNLQVANFDYEFSGQKFGNKNSKLQLMPEWSSATPPSISVDVVGRRGCDLNQLSVNNECDCEKLVAYLWPDQIKRIERVQIAIEVAKQSPPLLDRADAADWVEDIFVNTEDNGSVKVLFHTIAQNYFPQSVKDRIMVAMEKAGQLATEENPIAWLVFEFEGDGNPKLILKTWPSNKVSILATADPHVHSVSWVN